MHFAKNWEGNVEWKTDSTSVISTQAKLSWLPAREWMQQSNRDIYGNMAWIQPQLAGTWDITHQKSHVEDRKKDRNEWDFSEWGNFHADALCDIIMRLRAPNPIAPWKLESVVPWSCSFADNGDRIVVSVLSFVTTTRQNITSSTRMANSELFSCIVPVNNQRTYSADEHIDQRLMQNVWSLSDTLAERKIRVLSMWGMSLSNKYLHRWKLTDSADCATCKCVEADVHICTTCQNPDI